MQIYYIEPENLETIFQIVYENYAKREEVPRYEFEQSGIEKLKGVLNGVRMDKFYPDFVDKTAYLFTQINEGHFFSNGNKRLALTIATVFIYLNGYQFRASSKEEYHNVLRELFPKYTDWQDADNKKYVVSFDDLKIRVRGFFSFAVIK